jgi:predicted nucleic acid-binding protein
VVLVDTSVWIRFLADREPYASQLDELLRRGEAIGHELVFGEILVGDRGGRTRLLAAYAQMYQAAVVPHQEVVEFVRKRGLHGRGVGWIDVHLLASAIVGRFLVWTADLLFAAVATELGVAHKPANR